MPGTSSSALGPLPVRSEVATAAPLPRSMDRHFYLVMAIASTLLIFVAFSRTFYLRSYFTAGPLDAIVVIHGIVFSLWMLLFVTQTALIDTNRPQVHGKLGFAMGALAIVMVVLGTMVAFRAERLGRGLPFPDTIFLFSLADIVTFTIFVLAGFWYRHQPEFHQRLMLLSVTAGLLVAAPPRLPFVAGKPPLMALVGFSFLFAGPLYDLIMRRRLHRAYIWGCIFALVTGPPVRFAISLTPGWHLIARRLVGH